MLVCVGEATDQPDAKESDKATLASAEVGSYPFGGDATVLEGLLAPGAVELLCGVRGDANALPATKEFVRTTAPQQDILHFACHGMFRPEYGVPTAAVAMRPVKTSPLSKALASWRADALDSCLVLSSGRALFSSTAEAPTPDSERSDFLLKAREILDLKLSATLATLRACSSGRSDPKRGDEHLGLVRAFILAGCLSVLASLWDVNVRTSQKLLETFYRSWLGEERLPKWKALQRAQVEMLRGDHSHPYHWAPFILSGHWL